DMGISPEWGPGYTEIAQPGRNYEEILAALEDNALKLVYLVGADPAYDDLRAENALRQTKAYVVVQDMFLTPTAELADVVLPTQSVAERSGTYASGERRVQRFYPAVEPIAGSLPDWQIIEGIAASLGHGGPATSEATLFRDLARVVPQYAGMTYATLAWIEDQWPDVGGDDLYYGGTSYQNFHGLGQQWASAAEDAGAPLYAMPAAASDSLGAAAGDDTLIAVPISLLYDREPIFYRTELLHQRIPVAHAGLNPADAARLGVQPADMIGTAVEGRGVAAGGCLHRPAHPAGRRDRPAPAPAARRAALGERGSGQETGENGSMSDIAVLTLDALVKSAIIILILLTGFAYTTVLERRFIARLQ